MSVLVTAARETRFRSGAFCSRIAQLMAVDCLFTAVAQSSYDQSMYAPQRTYDAMNSRSDAPRRGIRRASVIRRAIRHTPAMVDAASRS